MCSFTSRVYDYAGHNYGDFSFSNSVGAKNYALGGNEQATALSGVNTGWIKFLVFTLSGLLAGLGNHDDREIRSC
jgi:hypothetical protein